MPYVSDFLKNKNLYGAVLLFFISAVPYLYSAELVKKKGVFCTVAVDDQKYFLDTENLLNALNDDGIIDELNKGRVLLKRLKAVINAIDDLELVIKIYYRAVEKNCVPVIFYTLMRGINNGLTGVNLGFDLLLSRYDSLVDFFKRYESNSSDELQIFKAHLIELFKKEHFSVQTFVTNFYFDDWKKEAEERKLFNDLYPRLLKENQQKFNKLVDRFSSVEEEYFYDENSVYDPLFGKYLLTLKKYRDASDQYQEKLFDINNGKTPKKSSKKKEQQCGKPLHDLFKLLDADGENVVMFFEKSKGVEFTPSLVQFYRELTIRIGEQMAWCDRFLKKFQKELDVYDKTENSESDVYGLELYFYAFDRLFPHCDGLLNFYEKLGNVYREQVIQKTEPSKEMGDILKECSALLKEFHNKKRCVFLYGCYAIKKYVGTIKSFYDNYRRYSETFKKNSGIIYNPTIFMRDHTLLFNKYVPKDIIINSLIALYVDETLSALIVTLTKKECNDLVVMLSNYSTVIGMVPVLIKRIQEISVCCHLLSDLEIEDTTVLSDIFLAYLENSAKIEFYPPQRFSEALSGVLLNIKNGVQLRFFFKKAIERNDYQVALLVLKRMIKDKTFRTDLLDIQDSVLKYFYELTKTSYSGQTEGLKAEIIHAYRFIDDSGKWVYHPLFLEKAPNSCLLLPDKKILVNTFEKLNFEGKLKKLFEQLSPQNIDTLVEKIIECNDEGKLSGLIGKIRMSFLSESDEQPLLSLVIDGEEKNIFAGNILKCMEHESVLKKINTFDPSNEEKQLFFNELRRIIFKVETIEIFKKIFEKAVKEKCYPILNICIERYLNNSSYLGKIILFQDDDISFKPEFFEQVTQFFKKRGFKQAELEIVQAFILNHWARGDIFNGSVLKKYPALILLNDLEQKKIGATLDSFYKSSTLKSFFMALKPSERNKLLEIIVSSKGSMVYKFLDRIAIRKAPKLWVYQTFLSLMPRIFSCGMMGPSDLDEKPYSKLIRTRYTPFLLCGRTIGQRVFDKELCAKEMKEAPADFGKCIAKSVIVK